MTYDPRADSAWSAITVRHGGLPDGIHAAQRAASVIRGRMPVRKHLRARSTPLYPRRLQTLTKKSSNCTRTPLSTGVSTVVTVGRR